MEKRLSKGQYYLGIAEAVSKRATCLRRRYGAVLVVEDEIKSTGYCGSPRGALNCVDAGYCRREKEKIPHGERYEYCASVHAEQNALISAARRESIGGTMYIFGEDLTGNKNFKVEPCIICKRMIINAGIKKVIAVNSAGDVFEYDVDDWLSGGFMLYGNKEEIK